MSLVLLPIADNSLEVFTAPDFLFDPLALKYNSNSLFHLFQFSFTVFTKKTVGQNLNACFVDSKFS